MGSDWDAKEIDGVRVRTLNDPNESDVMAQVRADWWDPDIVGPDLCREDRDYRQEVGVEIEQVVSVRDLPGWERLTDLELMSLEAVDVLGYSCAEFAREYGTTENAVWKARQRAKQKLQEK
ncbi:MAG: RNA polymerase sigma factor [Planctomycetota bacterium]|jgi:DNA-directed RNA polymerase specialized sigma24 family protein